MNRRTFLCGLTLGTLSAPLAAEAQPAGRRVPRIGFLQQGDPSASITLRVTEALRQGLREHGGYVAGPNLSLEYSYGDLDGVRGLANDLLRLKVDVIFA